MKTLGDSKMNKTDVKNFFTKPIGDIFKINFENHNRVPKLVTKTDEFKNAPESVRNSANWQLISNIISENVDFDKYYDRSESFRDTIVAVTQVNGTYYIFKVAETHSNNVFGGEIIHHRLGSDMDCANTDIDMFDSVCEFLRKEYGDEYLKQLVQNNK